MGASSVEDFNKTFSHLKRTIEVVIPLTTRSAPQYPPIEEMLRMAEKLYLDMSAANEWTGATSKGNQSTFVATVACSGKKLTCWNCGVEGHSLKECPKTVVQANIDKNKKAFKESKKKAEKKKDDKKTPTGKWAPPSANENNNRIIEGVPRFWLSKTKRWVKDRDSTTPTVHAHVATPTVLTASSSITPVSTTTSSSTTGRELALANSAHSIYVAIQGLMNSLKDT
jgi:Zinc knuckle